MTREKLLNLFCLYTVLSIGISLAAWCAVLLELVYVSPSVLSGISSFDWRLALCIYALGGALVYALQSGKAHTGLFILYVATQAGAILIALSRGALYFPAAGSQGTLPAIFISLAALAWFIQSRKELSC